MKLLSHNFHQPLQGKNFIFKGLEGGISSETPRQAFGNEFDQLSLAVWRNRAITEEIKFQFLIDPTNPPVLSSVKIQQISTKHPILKRIYKELTPFSVPILFFKGEMDDRGGTYLAYYDPQEKRLLVSAIGIEKYKNKKDLNQVVMNEIIHAVNTNEFTETFVFRGEESDFQKIIPKELQHINWTNHQINELLSDVGSFLTAPQVTADKISTSINGINTLKEENDTFNASEEIRIAKLPPLKQKRERQAMDKLKLVQIKINKDLVENEGHALTHAFQGLLIKKNPNITPNQISKQFLILSDKIIEKARWLKQNPPNEFDDFFGTNH